jgi:hypothetical protein
MLKRKILKKSRNKDIVQRRISNSDIRNEVFLLIVFFQEYLSWNEIQSAIHWLNDSILLTVTVLGLFHFTMKISETVCYRSSDAISV